MSFNGPYSPGKWPEGSFFHEMERIDEAECWHRIYGDYTHYKRKRSRLSKQVSNGLKLTAAVMSANFCKPKLDSPIKRVREFLKNLLRTLCNNEESLFPVQWDFTTRDDFCEHPTYSSTAETGVGNHQFMSAYRIVITFEYNQFDVLEETVAEKSIERLEFEDHKLSNIASNFPANRFEVAKKRFQHSHDFFKLLIEKCIDMLYGFVVHWKLRDEEKHQQDLLNFDKKNVLRVAQWSNVDFSVVKRALTKRSTSEDVEEEPPKKMSVEGRPLKEHAPSWKTPFPLLKAMTLNENGLQNSHRFSPDENSDEVNHNKFAAPAPKYVEQEAIESVREAPEEVHSAVGEKEEEEEDLFPRMIPSTSSKKTDHVLKVDVNSNDKAKMRTKCTPSPNSIGSPETSALSSPTENPPSSVLSSPTEHQFPIAQSSQTDHQPPSAASSPTEDIPPAVLFRLHNHRLARMRRTMALAIRDEEDSDTERETEIDSIVAFSERFLASPEHPMFAGRPRYFQEFSGFTRIRNMMFGELVEKWKDSWLLSARMPVMAKSVMESRRICMSNIYFLRDAQKLFGGVRQGVPVPFESVKRFVEESVADVFYERSDDENDIVMPKQFRHFDISVITNPFNFRPRNAHLPWFQAYDVPHEDGRYLKIRMEELCRLIMSDMARTCFFIRENPETNNFDFYYNRYAKIPKIPD